MLFSTSPGGIKAFLNRHPWTWIAGLMTISNILVYVPFLGNDFTAVYRHWDGPFYMYIAKTLYVIPPDNPFQNVAMPLSCRDIRCSFAC